MLVSLMAADKIEPAVQLQSADEMRVEFAIAQQRRLIKRGVVVVRERDIPDQGPTRADTPPK
jgi:hypothetical protein